MATYQWANGDDGGGDWDDAQNWEIQGQIPPAGPPGAGDDVIIILNPAGVITTDGATVASINDAGATLFGDLTVTGQLDGATVSGGAVVAGQFDFGVFQGTTLSVGSVSGGTNLDSGTVTAGDLIWAIVKGGTVSASSIDVDADDEVVVSNGAVSAQTLLLDEANAYLGVNAGKVTITDAVDIDGPQGGAGGIIVSGGQLSLEDGLELNGGGYLNDGSAVVASAGGIVTTPDLTIGGTGSGRVFVGGSNAHLNVTGDLIVGESGSGSLTVENGGYVVVGGNAESAVTSGSTATGTISDAAANLTFDKDWEIGVAGAAAWTLGGAASAMVAGLTELGVSSGGSGTLTLSDADTAVIAGGSGVIIGAEGQGTVTIQSGALLNDAAGDLTLAQAAKSKGTLQISDAGSTLTVGGAAVVGSAGSGAILLDGGSATFSGTLKLGESQGATGGLSVTGGGVTLAGDMTVGQSGAGSVTVGPGGTIGPGSLSIPTGSTDTVTLGDETTGKGTLTVSGVGASVKSLGLTVGDAGGGTLNIGADGRVDTTGEAIVGEAVTSIIQKVTVTSAGAWIVGDNLYLGRDAIATATVSSGGIVEVDGSLVLGGEAAATGILTLSGGLTSGSAVTPSQLAWGAVLDVGEYGTGNLTISSEAEAKNLAGGEGLIEVAAVSGSTGTLTVSGVKSELSAERLALGGGPSAAGGAGTLNLGSGGIAYFADGGVIWSGGKATVEGEFDTAGTLTVAGDLTVGGASSGARDVVGAGTLALTGGTTALNAGATLGVARVTQTGVAAVSVGATALNYAGVWTEFGGSIAVGAGDTLSFTGAGDSFTGILTGNGTVNFAAGTDSLSGVTLSAANTVINGAAVTLASAIDLTRTLTVVASPNLKVAVTGASLTGGGTLTLGSLVTNKISGVTAAATLTNVDDRIVGAGDIGGGAMSLTNDAAASIVGDSATVALTLDTGTKTITNAGVIASEGKGGVTIKSAVDNTGALEVTAGTLSVSGAVTGTGAVRIGGGTADFLAAFSQNVAFTGTTGVLELAKSQSYAGAVSGFSKTGGTSFDLGDIGFASGTTKASFVENSAGTSGVLTVTDGTHTAHITLTGDYASSTFTTSSDGHGGTIVLDPTKTPAAAVLSFVNAMAGFDADAGPGMIPSADPGRPPQPLLAVPHPSGRGAMATWT